MTTLFSQHEKTNFHDKAWKRAEMHVWDARWQRLSVPARRVLLDMLRVRSLRSTAPIANSASTLGPGSLAELQREGFVEVNSMGIIVSEPAVGFVQRMRALKRFALLDPKQPSQFDRYLNLVFASFDLATVVASIVERHTGQNRWEFRGDVYSLYVRQGDWPQWAAEYLDQPACRALVSAIDRANSTVPVDKLAALVPEQHPAAVRSAFDALVNHLVLFEDLDPKTFDLVTGFLPVVREDSLTLRSRKPAPPIEPVEPAEIGPEGGLDIPDLRATLLEISAGQPQIKQDYSLYAKEETRFRSALDLLPTWFPLGTDADRTNRMHSALNLCRTTKLADAEQVTDKSTKLALTAEGQRWLIADRESQYDLIFALLRDAIPSPVYPYSSADYAFLGSGIRSAHRRTGLKPSHVPMTLEDSRPLRKSMQSLFAKLPIGKFFVVEEFLNWASDVERNPLFLGHSLREVVVRLDYSNLVAVESKLAEVCRKVLDDFLKKRLIPLGCVQLGRDAQGRLLFARLPRLDGYFGQRLSHPVEAVPQSRVIVQPDFSIVVIGLDHAPVAELSPFCDRIQGRAAQGALTLRLSRESIFRGLATGLKSSDILGRLQKHAGNKIPANVLTEVTGWCEKVRSVRAATALLIRCPDAETAARVVGALGKHAERVGETAVAFSGKLTLALRQKLQAQGVLVAEEGKKK